MPLRQESSQIQVHPSRGGRKHPRWNSVRSREERARGLQPSFDEQHHARGCARRSPFRTVLFTISRRFRHRVTFCFAQLTTESNFRALQRFLLTALLDLGFWRVSVKCRPNLKSPMTTKTLEIALEDPGGFEYPNCYAAIPPNGKVCPHTGLRHTHLYTMLAVGGTARPHVRVVNLREPGAKKGKTLFHVRDFLRHLDRLAAQQGSGALRNARTE